MNACGEGLRGRLAKELRRRRCEGVAKEARHHKYVGVGCFINPTEYRIYDSEIKHVIIEETIRYIYIYIYID